MSKIPGIYAYDRDDFVARLKKDGFPADVTGTNARSELAKVLLRDDLRPGVRPGHSRLLFSFSPDGDFSLLHGQGTESTTIGSGNWQALLGKIQLNVSFGSRVPRLHKRVVSAFLLEKDGGLEFLAGEFGPDWPVVRLKRVGASESQGRGAPTSGG